MTATFSTKAFPFRNGLRVIKQNQKFAIVTCILELLGVPMIVLFMMLELIENTHQNEDFVSFSTDNAELYAAIGFFCLSVSVAMGMFSAIHSFTELHSKPKVDMLYSLPLTGTQRFFSDYLGGLGFYGLPYLVSCVVGLIEILVLGSFVNFDSTYIDDGLVLSVIVKYYLYATIGLFALMLMFFTLSTLVTVCCGTLFESIYTNFLLNGLIPGTMAAVLAVVTSSASIDFEYSWQTIGYTSPVGGLIYLIYMLADNLENATGGYHSYYANAHATQTTMHELFPTYIRWIFCILALTAVMLAGAWQLYKRRKAEAVGQPFVYIGTYYIMLTLVTVLILCLLDVDVVGPALMFSAIVYFIMEVVRKRGFRRFWVSIITYIVTVGVTIGFFYLCVETGIFGRVNYVPSPATVSSVKVNLQSSPSSGYEIELEYTDHDIIKAVTEQHRNFISLRKDSDSSLKYYAGTKVIDNKMIEQRLSKLYYSTNIAERYETKIPVSSYSGENRANWQENTTWEQIAKEPENYHFDYTQTSEIQITYYTITGSTIHRRYYASVDELQHFHEIFMGTSLYGEAMENLMNSRTRNKYSQYDSKGMGQYIPSSLSLCMYYDPDIDCNRYSSYEDSHPVQNKTINGEADLKKLASAYGRDVADATPESMRTAKLFGMICGVPIYENDTETVELLKSWGFAEFSVAQRYRFKDEYSPDYYRYNTLDIRIYAPDTYSCASVDFPCSTIGDCFVKDDAEGIPAYQDFYFDTANNTQLATKYPELSKLLEVAQPHYVAAEGCYAVVVNGHWYIVPKEHSDIVHNVIKLGSFHFSGAKASTSSKNTGRSTTVEDDDTYFDGNSYDPSFGSF